ncbi:MAG: translation initiation factor IF-2 [Tissierellia bacterium]|nr:translation initiation factor IF-2 [Tissierellia bacterium]
MTHKRVYTLAKEMGISSKDLVELLQNIGVEVKSHMSTLTEDDIKQLTDFISRAKKQQMKKIQEQKAKTEAKRETPRDKGGSSQGDRSRSSRGGGDHRSSRPQGQGGGRFGGNNRPGGGRNFAAKKPVAEQPQNNAPAKRKSANGKKKEKSKSWRDEQPIKPQMKSRSQKRKERQARQEAKAKEVGGTFKISTPITIKEFSEETGVGVSSVIMQLMNLGIMATQNESIDEDVVLILADEFDMQVEIVEEGAEDNIEEIFQLDPEDKEEELLPRPPVVTVMGHVDHGKTSLLDVIKKSNVTASEAGGITQHIGAYTVSHNGFPITFLDTPGHEAFTAMRSRGASITDIAILVVAADDGVMPQTVEAIHHAKVAEVPIIVAINKIDKEGANPDRVKQELSEEGLMPEDWGGDTIMINVSAKTEEGIPEVLEMIQLVAEMKELKANPNRLAVGTVVEARLDKGKGPMATILVRKGTLRQGEFLVSGTSYGHVRAMTDDKKRTVKEAGPSQPVVVLGLSEVPNAGDTIYAVADEKTARSVAEKNFQDEREQKLSNRNKVSMENLFDKIKEGELKDLNIIIKADVKGTVEAISQSVMKIQSDEVKLNIIHAAAGGINESDVQLAIASNALVVGFNVRPNNNAYDLAKLEDVDIRTYRIIYDLLNDIRDAVSGMLSPDIVEEILGRCEVRQTFKLPNNNIVAGIYVIKGKVVRNGLVKVLREDIVIHEGPISSLKRFQDDAREIAQGYEGGLMVDNFNDIQVGDILECYLEKEVKKEI